MATITTRSGKGSPLTNNEVDANFTNLNTDKAELSGATFTGAITANAGVVAGAIRCVMGREQGTAAAAAAVAPQDPLAAAAAAAAAASCNVVDSNRLS